MKRCKCGSNAINDLDLWKALDEATAKLEAALQQACGLLTGNDFDLIEARPKEFEELAEWLKSRSKT